MEVFLMLCKNCGNEIADGNLFCNNCGAAVEAASAEEVVAAQPEVVAEAVPEVTTDPGKTMGIISLICGIASLVLPCIPCLGYLSFVPIVLGIVFGFIGMKKSKAAGFKNTLALVGIILSFSGIVIYLISIVAGAVIGVLGSASGSSYYY